MTTRTELARAMGFRCFYDPSVTKVIAYTTGVLWWKKIVLGAAIYRLPERMQAAVLMHECGHAKLRHLEKRILRFWMLLWPAAYARYFREQEHEADIFAAKRGYGIELAQLYAWMLSEEKKKPAPQTPDEKAWAAVKPIFNPPNAERIERLSSFYGSLRGVI